MATTEELEKEILAEMAADPVAYSAGPVNDAITIDGESRVISVPASEILFGVETDKDVERKHFRCPKIVGMALICLSTRFISVISHQIAQESHSRVIPTCTSAKMWPSMAMMLPSHGSCQATYLPVQDLLLSKFWLPRQTVRTFRQDGTLCRRLAQC